MAMIIILIYHTISFTKILTNWILFEAAQYGSILRFIKDYIKDFKRGILMLTIAPIKMKTIAACLPQKRHYTVGYPGIWGRS